MVNFIRSIANPSSAVEGLEPPGRLVIFPETSESKYPLALWLTGRQEEALSWLRQRIQWRQAQPPNPYNNDFVEYGEHLVAEMQDLLDTSASS